MDRTLFVDSRESARRGQESGHMPSGKDLRVGVPYLSYEPLSMTEIKLRQVMSHVTRDCPQAETKL